MATLTASAAQSTQPAIYRENGTVTRVVTHALTAALSAGDVIQMVKVPAGAIVNGVNLAYSFSAGAITVSVGDGNSASAYVASVVISATGATTQLAFSRGRSYSAEDTIDIKVTAVSAAPGTADLIMWVDYTCQNGG